jgi:hypothetical protein
LIVFIISLLYDFSDSSNFGYDPVINIINILKLGLKEGILYTFPPFVNKTQKNTKKLHNKRVIYIVILKLGLKCHLMFYFILPIIKCVYSLI